jgi:hypothetical protein
VARTSTWRTRIYACAGQRSSASALFACGMRVGRPLNLEAKKDAKPVPPEHIVSAGSVGVTLVPSAAAAPRQLQRTAVTASAVVPGNRDWAAPSAKVNLDELCRFRIKSWGVPEPTGRGQ